MEATHSHKHPNYVLIWVYLAVLTAVEVGVAFISAMPKTTLLIVLLFLAVWKALLVALYFMHLKFERWNLRSIALIPIPLALILIIMVLQEGF
jgi:cytochrome c oxidase subunit IV